MAKASPLYTRIRRILESAHSSVARSVNSTQVVANWLIGREIVEEEQDGNLRATYGRKLLQELSRRLTKEYGRGYSPDNLEAFRAFYLGFPRLISETPSRKLLDVTKSETPSRKSMQGFRGTIDPISYALRSQLSGDNSHGAVDHPPGGESWMPGLLHPNLSWSLYRHLLKVETPDARAFYEIEAIQQCWSARELERQIASLLFERLARSRDKAGVMRLATKGHEIASPADVFKDPVVIEFLGLPESHRLVESDLEQALLDQLQAFLLELGKGFAFVARQQRLTLDGDHFYIDLVFYHVVLKCYVLLDLKVGKLTHGDLGQLQLYVNYYDREKRTAGDQPTLGLILCTDKNDAVVKYTLGAEQEKKIFASRYRLHLPTEAELKAEVRRELKQLATPRSPA
jgi:predicted nuclease of restriction endonuclease-like (RecB) superfamily